MIGRDTIYALSSGRPPAGIAVVRISGRAAGETLRALTGRQPAPRRATAAALRDPGDGELLDRALVLWLPGPDTATGEDLVELHLHGGRAVIDGVLGALGHRHGLRAAQPGEFTRRAFENGRIDLAEAEGLGDLLAAETEGQRRAALRAAGGALSRRIADWQTRLLGIAAVVEAAIDYADEDDVLQSDVADVVAPLTALAAEIASVLARPTVERLRDGLRVVVAGPPNSGKSSLINALSGRDVAIASPIAGTTRDLIEVPLSVGGVPILLVDTAGLRTAADSIEEIGVAKARHAIDSADVVLWLGDDDEPQVPDVIALRSFADLGATAGNRLNVSAVTGENLDIVLEMLSEKAANLLTTDDDVAINRRQCDILRELAASLRAAQGQTDVLVVAEELRHALRLCDRITGRAGVEDMLDSLFGRFCLGK